MCFVWISIYDVSAELTDTNQYLVITKVRGGLSISQQEAQWFDYIDEI